MLQPETTSRSCATVFTGAASEASRGAEPLQAAPDRQSAPDSVLPATPELYAAYSAFVWRSLARLGVPADDREDLLQEVFVIVHRSRSSYRGSGRITSWLYGIALRVASRQRRRARVRSAEQSESEAEPVEHRTPEGAAATRQRVALLELLLGQLPAGKRTVFVMFEIEGYSCEEIAQELGIPIGTVYSRLHGARRSISDALPTAIHEARRAEPLRKGSAT